MKKNVLILTTSGGGGHLQAAEAKRQELLLQKDIGNIFVINVLFSWGLGVGRAGISVYNGSQKKGNVALQFFLGKLLSWADMFFALPFFVGVFCNLQRHEIDLVYDTQPLASGAIIKAIRFYNFLYKKSLVLQKIIVDMPTGFNCLFFQNIRKVSKKDKQFLTLHTTFPLLEEKETVERFWEKHCHISLENVFMQKLLVRQAFERVKTISIKNTLVIPMLFDQKEILQKVSQIVPLGSAAIICDNALHFSIQSEDFATLVMLGSQAAENATMEYLDRLLQAKYQEGRNYFFFIYCGSESSHLLVKVLKRIEKFPKHPHLIFVPMPYQHETTIALLLKRANVTITRAGGQTVAEILSVSKGKNYIHLEKDSNSNSFGMPVWEWGNAKYLMKHTNATLLHPEDFTCDKLF